MKTDHADLLNALDAMRNSPAYALRRIILYQAETLIVSQEQLIVSQERRIKALEALLNNLLDNASCCRSAIELAHNFNGEEWEARALPLLGRTRPGNAPEASLPRPYRQPRRGDPDYIASIDG